MNPVSLGALFSLSRSRRGARRSVRKSRHQRTPLVDVLEPRLVLSTASSITANFNNQAIPAGSSVWFSSTLTVKGPASSPVTLHVVNGAIDFTAGGTLYHVPVPNADIVIDPTATSASSTYDPTDNDWDTQAPAKGTGSVFMTGVELPLPSGLPGGVKSVTWSGAFWSDTKGISVNWTWSAAAYSGLPNDLNALQVQTVDSTHGGPQAVHGSAGTPLAFTSAVIPGATGNGGKDYTGHSAPGQKVAPTFGDGVSDYPFVSSNPQTSVAFNESDVLRAANLDAANGTFDVWYNDEHALALGVGQVTVVSSSGTTTTSYPVSPLTSSPASALDPAVGATPSAGNPAGTDTSGRPMAPSLYITDITNDPNSRSGDWQYGGAAVAPSAVFGTWKSFSETVNTTGSSPTVSLSASSDPAKNDWNLGAGSDPAPSGLRDEGYGAEIRWNLDDLYNQGVLIPGHSYRFYVIVHDGDQNKAGGDCGQASFTYVYPGPSTSTPTTPSTPPTTTPTPTPTPTPAAPASISGSVFVDFNFNGVQDSLDFGLAGVVVTLTGTDGLGNSVSLTATTDANGFYSFTDLTPGVYTISRPHAPGYIDNQSVVGTDNGQSDGVVTPNANIAQITLGSGDEGVDYNFTEISVIG